MKVYILVLLLLCLPCFYPKVCSQVFYFQNTETTLNKETNQSPAHWYIEIHSNLEVDTVLRWRSEFQNIPEEWDINLDCQTVNFPEVYDLDSADFILTNKNEIANNGSIPQKLVIGATLNDTPGKGTILFDIYDPNEPENSEQIKFNFFISLSESASSQTNNKSEIILFNEGIIKNNTSRDLECAIFDAQGRSIHYTNTFKNDIDLSKFRGEVVFINIVDLDREVHHLKVVL